MQTEKEKFNKYLEKNYNRLVTHIKNACFFQTFQWSLDYWHDTLIEIYEHLARNKDYQIDYNKVEQLLFMTYKFVAISKNNKYEQKVVMGGDMTDYSSQLLFEELDINEYYEPEFIQAIIDSVHQHFDKEHIQIFDNFMNGGKLEQNNGEQRKMLEDIKVYVRLAFRPHSNKILKHNRLHKSVNQYDLNHKLVKTWESINELVDAIKIDRGTITKIINNKKNQPRYGYYWNYGRRRSGKV